MNPITAKPGDLSSSAHPVPATRWALASLALSMLMPSLDTSIANAALPTLAQAFSASFQAVQWIVLAYLLVITTMIVGVGRLGDIVGRRRLMLAGISLFTLGSFLCGVSPLFWFLIAARVIQGLGAAVMMALTVAMVSQTVPARQIGGAMGLLAAMSAVGTTLGPSLGGLLTAAFGWRWIFLVNLPLGLLNLLLASRFLSSDPVHSQTKRPAYDHPGTLLLALALAAYALAMTLGRGAFTTLNIALLLAAALAFSLFLLVEYKSSSPLIHLSAFRNATISAGLAMNTLIATVLMATLVVGPFYLTRALGLQTALVGLVLSVGPLVAAIAGVPAGRLVDRIGTRPTATAGLTLIASGCLALSLLPSTLGITGYLIPIVTITAGYALFQAANNTAIMTNIHPDQRGVISGLLSLSRNLGLITGASVMGAIFAHASPANDISAASPKAIAAGMHLTFAVAVFLVLIALTVAFAAHSRSPAA